MEDWDVRVAKRRRIVIDNENFYLTVGTNFVFATVPRENDPMMAGTRLIVETLCREITTALGGDETE